MLLPRQRLILARRPASFWNHPRRSLPVGKGFKFRELSTQPLFWHLARGRKFTSRLWGRAPSEGAFGPRVEVFLDLPLGCSL